LKGRTTKNNLNQNIEKPKILRHPIPFPEKTNPDPMRDQPNPMKPVSISKE
jgi:hypothetical protein